MSAGGAAPGAGAGAGPERASSNAPETEAKIARWRRYLTARAPISQADADELEDHLRSQIRDLRAAGLSPAEAFLIGVSRMGAHSALAGQFARTESARLWKQLVLSGAGRGERRAGTWAMLGFAVAAGLAAKAPMLAWPTGGIAARVAPTLALAVLAAYVAWTRRLAPRVAASLGAGLLALLGLAALYPFAPRADTADLMLIHLPVVAWCAVGVAYASGRWRAWRARMDFVRFTGEWAVYMVLLALGGGALVGLTGAIFAATGLDIQESLASWVLVLGAGGAGVVAAWLVEAKREIIESVAPVLGRVFTPLAALAVAALLVAAGVRGGFARDRDALMLVDALLVVVLALQLYTLSAEDARARPALGDLLGAATSVGALALDAFAVVAMVQRLAGGLTPNRFVALGLNAVLLVNLAVGAVLGVRRLVRREGAGPLQRWQMAYLPVFAAWAAFVVVAVPPLFGFR